MGIPAVYTIYILETIYDYIYIDMTIDTWLTYNTPEPVVAYQIIPHLLSADCARRPRAPPCGPPPGVRGGERGPADRFGRKS